MTTQHPHHAVNRASARLHPSKDERGVALIVTLAILAMLTVLLVAFVNNVRTERQASQASTQQTRARLAAQAAIDAGIFQMRTVMAVPNYATWVSNVYFTNGFVPTTNPVTLANTNPVTLFYSPVAAQWLPATTRDFTNFLTTATLSASNNFNEQGFMFPEGLVSNVIVPWTYVHNSFAASNNPVQYNRSIMRYGYWIEDESSKLNINTAYNTNGPGGAHTRSNIFDTSTIELIGLPGFGTNNATALASSRSPLYESVASILEIAGIGYYSHYYITNVSGGGGASMFATVNNGEYERQDNGRLRLRLNNYYTNTIPGIDVTNLVTDIGREMPGLTNKFAGLMFKLASNIRDQMDVDDFPCDSENPIALPFSTNGYLGIDHLPYLNEFQFSTDIKIQIVGANYNIGVTNTVVWEFFNLWDTPFVLPSTRTNVTLMASAPAVSLTWPGPPAAGTTNFGGTNLGVSVSGMVIPAYSFRVFTNGIHGFAFTIPTNNPSILIAIPTTGTITNLMGTTNSGVFYRQDLAMLPSRTAFTAPAITLSPAGFAVASNVNTTMHAAVGDLGDPRINDLPADWVTNTPTSFGLTNTASYIPGGAGGDMDTVATVIADGGFPFMNTNFLSPGFLGNVSYPAASSLLATNSWKTFKFFGDGYSNYNLLARMPDAALIDLFTVNTPGALTPGKMNVNNMRDLLSNVGATPAISGSLLGLFYEIPLYSGTVVTTNMLSSVIPGVFNRMPFYSIADLSYVAAFTNGAPVAFVMDSDKRREAIIRAISGITTVRGNHFTIWGRGQNLSTVQGRTNVVGDAFIQAIVERIPLHDNITGSVTNQQFRVKSYRYLSE